MQIDPNDEFQQDEDNKKSLSTWGILYSVAGAAILISYSKMSSLDTTFSTLFLGIGAAAGYYLGISLQAKNIYLKLGLLAAIFLLAILLVLL